MQENDDEASGDQQTVLKVLHSDGLEREWVLGDAVVLALRDDADNDYHSLQVPSSQRLSH